MFGNCSEIIEWWRDILQTKRHALCQFFHRQYSFLKFCLKFVSRCLIWHFELSMFWRHDILPYYFFCDSRRNITRTRRYWGKCYEELAKAEEHVVKMGDQLQDHDTGTPEIVHQILVLNNCSLLNSNAWRLLESFSSSEESTGPLPPETPLGGMWNRQKMRGNRVEGAWACAPEGKKEESIEL